MATPSTKFTRAIKWLPVAVSAAVALAGCGGGGGGGGGGAAPGSLKATGVNITSINANVTGAAADTRTVRIYGDQRSGPANAYASSHRLSMVLYRPVTPGSFPIAVTQAAGTSTATYVETALVGGAYKTSGVWAATSGAITVTAADNRHVEGSFSLVLRNTDTGGTIQFQDGTFNVAYEAPPPPTG